LNLRLISDENRLLIISSWARKKVITARLNANHAFVIFSRAMGMISGEFLSPIALKECRLASLTRATEQAFYQQQVV
jgi:hypothetical protein